MVSRSKGPEAEADDVLIVRAVSDEEGPIDLVGEEVLGLFQSQTSPIPIALNTTHTQKFLYTAFVPTHCLCTQNSCLSTVFAHNMCAYPPVAHSIVRTKISQFAEMSTGPITVLHANLFIYLHWLF